jgi:hypothetical protein
MCIHVLVIGFWLHKKFHNARYVLCTSICTSLYPNVAFVVFAWIDSRIQPHNSNLAFDGHVNQTPHYTSVHSGIVVTLLWGKCEVTTHTPENGTWESSETPKNSEFNCKGQKPLPWVFLYTVGKVLKLRCQKWPRMSHSDICSTSYVRKKGRESNW